jgi:hypothetical protein
VSIRIAICWRRTARRSREEIEYELLDTGVFDDDRYFDVFVEYAKADPEDLLVKISVYDRGPEAAEIHVLPTLWYRNTWSWETTEIKPALAAAGSGGIKASHPELGDYILQCEGSPELLFTENESNAKRLWGERNTSAHVKDAFHEYVIFGNHEAVNPAKSGTKAAAHYVLNVPPGEHRSIRLRLSTKLQSPMPSPFSTKSSRFAPTMPTSSTIA